MTDANGHREDTRPAGPEVPGNGLRGDGRTERGTFILLLLLTCVLLVVLAVVLWLVPYVGFSNIHPQLPLIMALLFLGIVMFMIGGGLTLVFTIIRGKNLFFNRRIRGVMIRFLFPMLVVVGRLVGIGKDRVRRSFIAANNQLVVGEARRIPPHKLLILLPQCLQYHECEVRITSGRVENCKGCGRCKIKNLVAMSQQYGVSISVATGGTLARKIVVDKRPDMIIGVACERDLTSGIQDTYPIPVYGILNRRPHGPCYDTDVDLDVIEEGMRSFLGYGKGQAKGSGPERPEPAAR
ncbi:MAG: DUF116 domain-containing protein [Thermodesulfobacteriota bacterium]